MSIGAGDLDELITLQEPVETRGAMGDTVRAWGTTAENVWASVVTVRGQEFFAALQEQYRVDIRVRIRHREGVTNRMRIIWRGEPYAVTEVMDGGPRRDYIEMMCTKGVEDGR